MVQQAFNYTANGYCIFTFNVVDNFNNLISLPDVL